MSEHADFKRSYTGEIFAKIDQDFEFLLQDFREVLRAAGQPALGAALPWYSAGESHAQHLNAMAEMHALSIAFQLLNLVEENASLQGRRIRERDQLDAGEAGLWPRCLKELQSSGYSEMEIAEILDDVAVEPVLTAHPTESKRPAVLRIHRAIYLQLLELENTIWTRAEREEIHRKIRSSLERLWRTGEIMLQKPEVRAERNNVIYYLREIFPKVLPKLDFRLREAWREAGFEPDLLERPEKLPGLKFGNWVGGDRDGHPLVTAEVTRETLEKFHHEALDLLEGELAELDELLTLSEAFQQAPGYLKEGAARLEEKLGRQVADHNREPWRRYAQLIRARLIASRCRERGAYESASELEKELDLLRQSLMDINASRLARTDVAPIQRIVRVFGLHLASLDIRQNSAFHDKALTQLLLAAGFKAADFPEWPECRRVDFLNKELESPRPLAPRRVQFDQEAAAVLDCYRVLAEHYDRHGSEGLGTLIISMTRQLSDLLVVYILAREAGLMRPVESGQACLMPVTPLFETIQDLEDAPDIMDHFLSHPITRNSLNLQKRAKPIQQVMIGYSDSSKDGGIFASQWRLHKTQAALAAVARKHAVRLEFFHGRGGTPSRGSGPTHRFLEALPHGSLHGVFRLTEQGETIAQKYGNLGTATYNLELLLSGVARETLKHSKPEDPDPEYAELVEKLSLFTMEAYQGLVHSQRLISFWAEATPIDVLEQSTIGSRPSRRTGKRTLADLRAIPWVFSWNQARYYLPGWYGIGSGLRRLKEEHPDHFEFLQQRTPNDTFLRNVFYSAETSLASAHLDIMKDYAGLVTDHSLREEVYEQIVQEYRLTDEMIDALFQRPRSERRPRMLFTIERREQGLRRLHDRQIALLRDWRARQKEGDEAGAAELLDALLLSVNAIASGLRTTG